MSHPPQQRFGLHSCSRHHADDSVPPELPCRHQQLPMMPIENPPDVVGEIVADNNKTYGSVSEKQLLKKFRRSRNTSLTAAVQYKMDRCVNPRNLVVVAALIFGIGIFAGNANAQQCPQYTSKCDCPAATCDWCQGRIRKSVSGQFGFVGAGCFQSCDNLPFGTVEVLENIPATELGGKSLQVEVVAERSVVYRGRSYPLAFTVPDSSTCIAQAGNAWCEFTITHKITGSPYIFGYCMTIAESRIVCRTDVIPSIGLAGDFDSSHRIVPSPHPPTTTPTTTTPTTTTPTTTTPTIPIATNPVESSSSTTSTKTTSGALHIAPTTFWSSTCLLISTLGITAVSSYL